LNASGTFHRERLALKRPPLMHPRGVRDEEVAYQLPTGPAPLVPHLLLLHGRARAGSGPWQKWLKFDLPISLGWVVIAPGLLTYAPAHRLELIGNDKCRACRAAAEDGLIQG
jgi:hypothetical protein